MLGGKRNCYIITGEIHSFIRRFHPLVISGQVQRGSFMLNEDFHTVLYGSTSLACPKKRDRTR